MTQQRTKDEQARFLLLDAREAIRNYRFEDAIRAAERAFDLSSLRGHKLDALDMVEKATQSMTLRNALAECWQESRTPHLRRPTRRNRIYDWDDSFRAGKEAEDFLDRVFGREFDVTEPDRQSEGIDRSFVLLADEQLAFTVDYKADFVAKVTMNLAVETVTNVETGARGWAYKSAADYIMFFPVGHNMLLLVPMDWIRKNVDDWNSHKDWQHRVSTRRGSSVWETDFLRVPLNEFEHSNVLWLQR